MNQKDNYQISTSTLASLVQYMAYAQKEFIYEHLILRTTSKGFKDYTDEQQEMLRDRISSVLPYQAQSLGQHINALLRDYPALRDDEYVMSALKDRDAAITFVTDANKAENYTLKLAFNPDDADSVHGI